MTIDKIYCYNSYIFFAVLLLFFGRYVHIRVTLDSYLAIVFNGTSEGAGFQKHGGDVALCPQSLLRARLPRLPSPPPSSRTQQGALFSLRQRCWITDR